MNQKMNIDLNKVVKQGLATAGLDEYLPVSVHDHGEHLVFDDHEALVTEAYVTEPKTFGQTTEYLSQRTKEAHVELYKGYVESVNKISAELDTVDRQQVNSRHSTYRSLKLDETFNTNAAYLHELFFGNCFDQHSEIYQDSLAYMRIQRDFGDFETWQRDFMAAATTCGQGWVVCGYHLFLKRFVNTLISNHSQDVMMATYPVIVVDMHEHAYHRDYLTDKKSYLVAMMRQLKWDAIEDRFKKADAIAQAVK